MSPASSTTLRGMLEDAMKTISTIGLVQRVKLYSPWAKANPVCWRLSYRISGLLTRASKKAQWYAEPQAGNLPRH